MIKTSIVLAALGCAVTVQGHVGAGCGGHHVNKRNWGGSLKTYTPRQVTDEASAASSTGEDILCSVPGPWLMSQDPEYECTAYSYQPVLDMKPNYPSIWNTAYLMPNDTEAAEIFATVNASVNSIVPNIQPRGTPAGDWSGVNYNASDPDCWWTWKG